MSSGVESHSASPGPAPPDDRHHPKPVSSPPAIKRRRSALNCLGVASTIRYTHHRCFIQVRSCRNGRGLGTELMSVESDTTLANLLDRSSSASSVIYMDGSGFRESWRSMDQLEAVQRLDTTVGEAFERWHCCRFVVDVGDSVAPLYSNVQVQSLNVPIKTPSRSSKKCRFLNNMDACLSVSSDGTSNYVAGDNGKGNDDASLADTDDEAIVEGHTSSLAPFGVVHDRRPSPLAPPPTTRRHRHASSRTKKLTSDSYDARTMTTYDENETTTTREDAKEPTSKKDSRNDVFPQRLTLTGPSRSSESVGSSDDFGPPRRNDRRATNIRKRRHRRPATMKSSFLRQNDRRSISNGDFVRKHDDVRPKRSAKHQQARITSSLPRDYQAEPLQSFLMQDIGCPAANGEWATQRPAVLCHSDLDDAPTVAEGMMDGHRIGWHHCRRATIRHDTMGVTSAYSGPGYSPDRS